MKIVQKDQEKLPFTGVDDIRFWAKNNGGRPFGWSYPGTQIPDFWLYHTDHFGNENTVWVSLITARKYTKKTIVQISPALRHSMLGISAKPATKVGLIIAIKDTHALYAVRLRSVIFGGEIDLDLLISNGIAIELDRPKRGELARAIEFISRDDGEVSGRWW